MDRRAVLCVAHVITVHAGSDLAALPAAARALLHGTAEDGIFLTDTWFATVLAHAMPAASQPHFLFARDQAQILGLLALRIQARRASSLTTPYSCGFAPIFAPALDAAARLRVATALAGACRAWPVTRLEALEPNAASTLTLADGARAAGLAVRPFNHFGNWHEAVAGRSWAEYLADRPGDLRTTVRRKQAAAQRAGAQLRILRDGPGLAAAIAGYADVYARSWKQAEPFPDFNAAMMRAFAPTGQLRLGLFEQAGQVIAAQIWLVADGTATVVKLAHDDAARAASPGTVLTAHMLRHLLDEEAVHSIDFGRGDHPYKRAWASARRQKIGLLLINPRQPAGLYALGRSMLGRLVRRVYPRQRSDSTG